MLHDQDILDALAGLRVQIEHDTGSKIRGLDLNAACLLEDVCQALNLTPGQTRAVLGQLILPSESPFVPPANFSGLTIYILQYS